jgi:preprotein translocase subunit SecE
MRDEDLQDGHDEPEHDSDSPAAEDERVGASGATSATPAPRTARFGEGPEGRPARRERGLEAAREGFFSRVGTFWRDVRTELRRVSWPTLKEVQSTTVITVIAVAFFAAYLWVIDQGISKALNGLTKLLGG